MLNEELFDNKKDARIADLTQKSEAFKRYNEKRKEQYRKARIRLSEAKEPKLSFDDPIIWKKMGNMEDTADLYQEIEAFKEYYKKELIRLGKIEKTLDSMESKDPKIRNLKLEIEELKAKINNKNNEL